MKRTFPLFVLVGVAGALVPVLAVFAQTSSSRPVSCCPSATCASGKNAVKSSTDDQVIEELIAILKETKSPETFTVTATVLGYMGPEARRALPALIRNAERLELLEDLFDTNATESHRAAQVLAEAIEMIVVESNSGVRVRTKRSRPQTPTSCTPATPYSYGGACSNAPPQPCPMSAGVAPSTIPLPNQPGELSPTKGSKAPRGVPPS
jgi:hypothetical protein